MSLHESAAPDQYLLRELMDGLSLPGRASGLSLGIVGSATYPPLPPGECLRTCLDGDPGEVASRGCPFLAGAARNNIDLKHLRDGRCPKDYQVAAQHTILGGEPAVLITVEGKPETRGATGNLPARAPRGAAEAELLGHLDTAARLVQSVGLLLEENQGFANEVLQNYEQLNLIFDLTQQISQVTDVQAIERLLLQRVARLLVSECVYLLTSTYGSAGASPSQYGSAGASPSPNECRAYAAGGDTQGPKPVPPISPDEVKAAADFVRRTRQVHVRLVGDQHVIAGPLVRLDDKVDVMLAVRRASQGVFYSGDMMLIESVLAFGGQIISNTELHERLRRMSLEVTRAMVSAIDKKDHYTSGHSERVGFLTRLTAAELGISSAEQQNMGWSGLLHDVGKIGIPEEILCKPGKLTAEEFEVIKQHPRMGYEILKPIASMGVILDGILHHHEYPDGSGYPAGLAGEAIPLVARIIHVADTFDALTSTRSYRRAFGIEQALEIIREDQGTRIDAEVAEAFFQALAAYRRDAPDDFAARFARVNVAAGPRTGRPSEREVEHANP
ncbi:MAG: HD-GYP domain-containing protein [Phycisphaerae bacterium]|nr:HD-GYP domain-containing protein [Phycisphaerae bacterium]